ncbi:hypothetical protein QRD89_06955 [Halobacillus sp. ACCC02827]|uniref:hypothetical protein n=1 Tax=Bacillaceae TaxID=186817 RepID=UPI000428262E|nr:MULTISPECIES: hypothetical protein [Bacillaceae]QHT46263.1 hypothetical protein M662_07060 [Bacillus sp. SB49]WJE17083.1 hypothetical protein QRD89_06955 [Halobacillus sp. ACCC02827]
MKWKKQDEMEKHQSGRAAKNGFVYYTVVLLIWSIYNQITKGGDGGWQYTILIGGVAVYFLSRVYYNRKVNG